MAKVVLRQACNFRYKDKENKPKELFLKAGLNEVPDEVAEHPYIKALVLSDPPKAAPRTQAEIEEALKPLADEKLKADLAAAKQAREEAEEDRKEAAKDREEAKRFRAEAEQALADAKTGNGKKK